jgi:hypothetical protein
LPPTPNANCRNDGTCCVFWRIRPEMRARSALTGFLTDVDNPSETTHRIPHLQSPASSFLGPTTHQFSHLRREFPLPIKILQRPEEKISKRKEEALRVVHNGNKTPSNRGHRTICSKLHATQPIASAIASDCRSPHPCMHRCSSRLSACRALPAWILSPELRAYKDACEPKWLTPFSTSST